MRSRSELSQHLRDHILGALHVGRLRAGDRLPSIREVAMEVGRNPRTVRAAYRLLEAEGLVQIRGRSGVFVATHEAVGSEVRQEIVRWLSSVAVEAWKRRIAIEALPERIRRATQATRLHCALIEEVHDGVVAFRHELEKEWNFTVEVLSAADVRAAVRDQRRIDFFAATNFYAPVIYDQVARTGKPLVVLTAHLDLQAAIRRRMNEGQLTVVAMDPRFEERIRVAYGAGYQRERVRLVLARDPEAVRNLPADEPVLLTRAAHQYLGDVALPLIFPHSPTISTETAHTLAGLLIQRNLDTKG